MLYLGHWVVVLLLLLHSSQGLEHRSLMQAPGPPGPQAAPPQAAPPLPPGSGPEAGLLPRFLQGEKGLVINSPIDPANLITPIQSLGWYGGRVGPGAYGSL